jgi:hypothetical protein
MGDHRGGSEAQGGGHCDGKLAHVDLLLVNAPVARLHLMRQQGRDTKCQGT